MEAGTVNEGLVLAIDQGTTASKVLLFDSESKVQRQAYRELTQHFPSPGWVEHDLREIWEGVYCLLQTVLESVDAKQVRAVAITNQRETTAVWDRKTGDPLAPAVVWQCRRSSEICRQLKGQGLGSFFRDKTGLMVDPYFSGTKLKWLLDNIPDLRTRAEAGEVCFGTIDAWLLWNLTRGRSFATDCSNASRTLLYNIYDLCWDDELLRCLGVPRAMMPGVMPSSHVFGETVRLGSLPEGIPIAGIIGDSQGALFGEACFEKGMVKATYGTGTSLMMFSGYEPVELPQGLVQTLSWGVGGQIGYALEGIINVTGATMQWLRDGIGVIEDVADSEAIAVGLEGNEGVYLVPAFVGLGAPYWDMEARGLICGLTRGTRREHLVRAGLESTAYQVRDQVELMTQAGGLTTESLRADGGGTANGFLMQFQADMLDADVACPAVREISALGAAYLSGLEVGVWNSMAEIAAAWSASRRFTPHMQKQERKRLYSEWKTAVARAIR